jgi:hypothetical protein
MFASVVPGVISHPAETMTRHLQWASGDKLRVGKLWSHCSGSRPNTGGYLSSYDFSSKRYNAAFVVHKTGKWV